MVRRSNDLRPSSWHRPGCGAERLTYPTGQSPTSISPDGTRLVFQARGDVMQLRLDGAHQITPLVQTRFKTGYVNLIVWSSLVDKQRKELLGSRLLGVTGEVQREGEVVHVLARKLEDHTELLGRLSTQSRDFH